MEFDVVEGEKVRLAFVCFMTRYKVLILSLQLVKIHHIDCIDH